MPTNRVMKALLLFIIIFNVIDLTTSALMFQNSSLEEANPVMAAYLDFGIIPFIMVKTILVGGGCIILWRFRERTLAKVGAFIAFNYYLALMFYLFFHIEYVWKLIN